MEKIKNIIYIAVIAVFLVCNISGILNKSYAENNTLNQTGNTNTNTKQNSQSTNTSTQGAETNKKSSNANLSNLGIRPNDFSGFKSATTTYDVSVPSDVSEIEIYASAQDQKSKITGTGTKKLEDGNNKFQVTVTAEDGTTKTYTLNITKKDGQESSSNPNGVTDGLEELDIQGVTLSPKFETSIYEYTAKYIGENTKLDIKTTATDPYFTVEVTGNENLIEGENLITILVSDPDGKNVATYQIVVSKSLVDEEAILREQAEKKKRNEKIILITIIAAALFAIMIILLIKHKRNKRYAEDYTVPYSGADDDYDYEYEDDDYYEDEYIEEDEEEMSKEDLKKKFLDNYNSYDYENDAADKKPKRRHHKGKRFK